MTIILFYYILVQKQDLHTNIHTKCIYATNTQKSVDVNCISGNIKPECRKYRK